MGKYILDTNIIIRIWKNGERTLENFLDVNKVLIVREVLEELAKKEKRRFKGAEIMSKRFMKLVPFMHDINRAQFKEFINNIKFDQIKGKAYYLYGNKLTEIDVLLIYVTTYNEGFSLVTEDLGLLDSAKKLLKKNEVLRLDDILNTDINKFI